MERLSYRQRRKIERKALIQKRVKKARQLKDGQENIDRWIKYKKQKFAKVNHRMKRVGEETGIGHQIGNRCYKDDGTYYLVNINSFRIIKAYDRDPRENKTT